MDTYDVRRIYPLRIDPKANMPKGCSPGLTTQDSTRSPTRDSQCASRSAYKLTSRSAPSMSIGVP